MRPPLEASRPHRNLPWTPVPGLALEGQIVARACFETFLIGLWLRAMWGKSQQFTISSKQRTKHVTLLPPKQQIFYVASHCHGSLGMKIMIVFCDYRWSYANSDIWNSWESWMNSSTPFFKFITLVGKNSRPSTVSPYHQRRGRFPFAFFGWAKRSLVIDVPQPIFEHSRTDHSLNPPPESFAVWETWRKGWQTSLYQISPNGWVAVGTFMFILHPYLANNLMSQILPCGFCLGTPS